jgi:hypothetical protein
MAILMARNATRLLWRLWWHLAASGFGGSLESVGQFDIVAFGRNLASVAVKMFLHLTQFFEVINALLMSF